MGALKGYSTNWDIVQMNELNRIQSVPRISVQSIKSSLTHWTFLLHIVASDFIIVVELTSEMALKSTQRSALFRQRGSIAPRSFFCRRFLPEWKTDPPPPFISPTFSDLGCADAFCWAFLLSVKKHGISLPSLLPRDNSIQGYHSGAQRGRGERAAAKLHRILVARECVPEWAGWM